MASATTAHAAAERWLCALTDAAFSDELYRPIANPGVESVVFELAEPLALDDAAWRSNRSVAGRAQLQLSGDLAGRRGESLTFTDFELRVNLDEGARRRSRARLYSYTGDGQLPTEGDDILAEWAPRLRVRDFRHPEEPLRLEIDAPLDDDQDLAWRVTIPNPSCRPAP